MKHLKQFNESSSGNPNDFIIKNIMSIIEDDDNFEVELEEVEDDIDDDDATWMQYKIAVQRVPGQEIIKNGEAISIIENIVQRLENEGLTAQVLLNGRHGIDVWKEQYSSSEYAFVLLWFSLLIWD